jgi:glycosyltransferase involved in cell wall biosynthesis
MPVLLVHNYYQQAGGEDQVVAAEGAMLEGMGHGVTRYTVQNSSISAMPKARVAAMTTWNPEAYREIRGRVRRDRPAVMHCHNTFPLISPAAYRAARDEGVPVVQTLHNYRLLCPSATFFRNGRPCEDCMGKLVPWPGVVHACYRDSRAATGAVATMLGVHRMLGTWGRDVDVYIALTEFARRKFIEGGLPADRVMVKPNFVHPDPGLGGTVEAPGGYALFVGRLAAEKGIELLLKAWGRVQANVPLKIVGDGPLAPLVVAAAKSTAMIEWLGPRARTDVLALMREASFLVVPSTWYEGLPMIVAEAFAVGLPIVMSDIGGLSELVEHGRTGLMFRSGDVDELSARVDWAFGDPVRLRGMRVEARAEFEAKYTAERNYDLLMSIYEFAAERQHRGAQA